MTSSVIPFTPNRKKKNLATVPVSSECKEAHAVACSIHVTLKGDCKVLTIRVLRSHIPNQTSLSKCACELKEQLSVFCEMTDIHASGGACDVRIIVPYKSEPPEENLYVTYVRGVFNGMKIPISPVVLMTTGTHD